MYLLLVLIRKKIHQGQWRHSRLSLTVGLQDHEQVDSPSILYVRDAQPAARGQDPAPEGVLSGPRGRLKIQETSPE